MIRIFMVGYSENKGGVEAYIINLNENMDHEKYEVIYNMPEMIIDGKKWVRPKNRHNYLKYRSFWKRFYKENHFDVLYLNTCDVVSIDALKFAKAAGIPIRIIHAHNSGNQQGIEHKMSLFHRLSEKFSRKNLHKYATHYFACSKVAGDWMFDGREYRVVQNGINTNKYRFNKENRDKCRKMLGICNEELIGCIGRLSPQKNPLFTVEIASKIIEKNPSAKVVMIGGGELFDDVNKIIKKKGLERKVILTGAVDNVNEWMSAIDCLLMPSLFEGLPFVLIEAQAAGLPCIVSSTVSEEANITGLVEYVSLEENSEEWTEKVLLACKKVRIDCTQQLIDSGYSIGDTAKIVSNIINEAYTDLTK